MSFGGSDRASSETLGEGIDQLKRQKCKVESDPADKVALQSELKDTSFLGCFGCVETLD